MTVRRIALSASRRTLAISHPREDGVVRVVDGLPDARWHPPLEGWVVPAEHIVRVWSALAPHGFELSQAARLLLAERATRRDHVRPATEIEDSSCVRPIENAPVGRGLTADSGHRRKKTADALTISQLNHRARRALRSAFPSLVWVSGEVLDWSAPSARGHHYFELVERDAAGAIQCRVRTVLWRDDRDLVMRRLAEATPPLAVEDGLAVRVRVSVDLWPQGGSYQIAVRDIDPAHTLAARARRRELILRTLRERGIADRNRALEVPIAPLRVALLTSANSDAEADFLDELRRSGLGFDVELFDTRVQGAQLVPSMLRALRAAFDRHVAHHPFDALVIVRGGGSRSDLSAFDDLDLAVAVATAPMPVLVGIGHHLDECVLDAITRSLKTPTAAAAHLVAACAATLTRLERTALGTERLALRHIRSASTVVEHLADRVVGGARSALSAPATEIDLAEQRLAPTTRRHATSSREALARSARELLLRTSRCTRRHADALAAAERRTRSAERHVAHHRRIFDAELSTSRLRQTTQRALARLDARLDLQAARVRASDPRRILELGFARIYAPDGRTISSIGDAASGDRLAVELRDGRLDVHVAPEQPETTDE